MTMLGPLLGPDIEELIAQRQFPELREVLTAFSPADVAEILEDLTPSELAVVFRILPRDKAADIFEHLPLTLQETLVHGLGTEDVAAVLNEMDPDDRTNLLEELPANVTQRLLALLTPQERKIATTLLGYPPESVGRRMTPDYVAIRPDWTIGEALNYIRRVGKDKETLNVLYVIDDHGRLIDDLKLRELILADPERRVSDLMDTKFVALRADEDQEECVRAFQRYDRVALPVTDSAGVLVGMVTVDDVLDVVEAEATEDMQKLGGMEALDMPYMQVGFFTMVRKRALWLCALFLGQTLTATAMGHFEEEISRAVVLALFVPLIISSGGNCGSQATSLIIRAFAVREVSLRDWWQVMYREMGAGFALGLVLGALALLRIVFWPWRLEVYGEHYVLVATAVALSLVGVVLYGSLVGAMLPFILRRIGLDPAVSSAPFVATLVDVMGIIIYFTIAALVLKGTLL
jgi:magnesium transporter